MKKTDGKCYSYKDKYKRLLIRFLKENDFNVNLININLDKYIMERTPLFIICQLLIKTYNNNNSIIKANHVVYLMNKWIDYTKKEIALDLCNFIISNENYYHYISITDSLYKYSQGMIEENDDLNDIIIGFRFPHMNHEYVLKDFYNFKIKTN